MWKFVAGLTHFKDVGLETVRLKMFKKYNTIVEVEDSLLPLLYEIQEEESIQAILGPGEVSYCSSQRLIYEDMSVDLLTTPFEHYSLGYCVAHSKCIWTLALLLINPEHTIMFSSGVMSQFQASSCICNLDLQDSNLQGSIEHFRKLPLSGTQSLNLSCCDLNGESLKILGHTIIPGMNSLESLNIRGNSVGGGEIVELLQSLSAIKSLHTLNLQRLTLNCDDIRALAPLVAPQEGSLRELIIGSSEMETAAVEKMLTILFEESSLQSLSIKDIDLQLSTDSLTELFEKNTNLKTLQLSLCNRRLTTVCAKALCKNTILETFNINRDIGNDSADVLSEALRINESLKTLSLYYSEIDEEGVAVLIDALQYNQTLEKMTLPCKFREFHVTDPRIVLR